jgi:hypothetical protein
MANGQIKDVGNAGKGTRIAYMKKFDVVLILLLVGCAIDDDPTESMINWKEGKVSLKPSRVFFARGIIVPRKSF